MDKIKFPIGAAEVLTPAYAANVSCDIWNTKTIIKPGQLTGNLALQLVPDAELMIGSEVSVQLTADGTNRTLTLGSNLLGASVAVNATKIVAVQFEWDGVKFVHRGTTALN